MEDKNEEKRSGFIEGGMWYFPRKTYTSEIWRSKPHQWLFIWLFIIGYVNCQDNQWFSRGSNFFTYQKIAENTRATSRQIQGFLRWARKSGQISTRKTTRGVIITVTNYGFYQDMKNYDSTKIQTEVQTEVQSESTRSPHGVHTINKEVKEVKEVKEGERDVQISENLHDSEVLKKAVEKEEAAPKMMVPESAPKKVLPRSAIPFEEFWAIWPNKKAKAPAQTAWEVLTVTTQRVIMNDIPMRVKCSDWTKDGGRFIPLPTTYIHQERWNDEIVEYKQDRPNRNDARSEFVKFKEEDKSFFKNNKLIKIVR